MHLRRVFENQSRWRLRTVDAAVFGTVIAICIALEARRDLPVDAILTLLIMIPIIFTVAGVALNRSDIVRRRIRTGKSVGSLSRLFFGSGLVSVVAWFGAVLYIGFPFAILIGAISVTLP